jgi:predicted nucleotidyltransferase component of viral defense system
MKIEAMKEILESQSVVLKLLAGAMDGFYLVGGTALSREYLRHRESYDLDFFTQQYSAKKIEAAIHLLERLTKTKARKVVDSDGKGGFVRMRRYELPLAKSEPLKIDFVKDLAVLLKPFNRVEGIDYASLDDIYLRKLYAVTGIITGRDKLGKIRTKGKRQEARDLFDLYHLSTSYKRLASFVMEFHEKLEIPAIIQWYYSLNKTGMSIGLQEDIVTSKPLEYVEISRHFKKEIDRLMKEIEG